MSPTARSLRLLRERGYMAQVVERFNPGARVRQDLFGFIDIVAINGRPGVLGVQTTTAANMAARLSKIRGPGPMYPEPVSLWLQSHNSIEVHGWSKRGPRGKRKTWGVTVTEIPGPWIPPGALPMEGREPGEGVEIPAPQAKSRRGARMSPEEAHARVVEHGRADVVLCYRCGRPPEGREMQHVECEDGVPF